MRQFLISMLRCCRPFAAAALVLGLTAPSQGDLITNLEGYWKFNGTGNDSSGNGRPLNLVGNPGFGPGLFDEALLLTGDPNQFAARPGSDAVFDLGNSDFTIQVWVNFTSTAGEQTLFEKFTGGSGPGYSLGKLANNDLRFTLPSNTLFQPGGTEVVLDLGGLTIDTDKWHQFLARRSGSTIELFFDRTSTASAVDSASYPASPNPLLIGEREGGQQFPVDGYLDEVAFWNRALSNSELTALYNNGQGLQISVPEPGSLLLTSVGGLALLALVYRCRKPRSPRQEPLSP